jgi:hypothetical protein
MCCRKAIHCRKSHAQTGERTWPTRRNEKIDIRKLEGNMLEEELYGAEEVLRLLHGRGQPHFPNELLAVDNTHAAVLRTGVGGHNTHVLL